MSKPETDHDDIRRMYPGEVLTDNQIRFARAYAEHGVGMRAIREAGYQFNTPGSQSSASNRLTKNPKIKGLIAKIKAGEIA